MEKLWDTISENMEIHASMVWKPGIYELYEKSGPVVTASNIVLDFTGVVLRDGTGSHTAVESDKIHEDFSYSDDTDEEERIAALGYRGIALTLRKVKNVTVRGLSASGFEIAVLVEECENVTIEDCNFSDNFHDVECGWNEHGPKGGIYLLKSHHCTIQNNRANRVWNAIYLKYSDYNIIARNDFSYCSNMCVKMWNSCHNTIDHNNLSWGLRIKPGEVHARDSAGLLMESGCDHNRIRYNDLTHGGDGIFIRVLNGWHSRYNLFEGNDCSYANNNAIEAWANDNVWLRNKANYSSYGFWMGGSDNTLMLENEIAWNGYCFKNAPEKFGNAGVAIANSSGTLFRLIGNQIHDNYGPGIAIQNEIDDPVHHLIIEDNHICRNHSTHSFQGHGIYLQNASWIHLSNNEIAENEGEEIFVGSHVSDIFRLRDGEDYVSIKTQFPPEFTTVGETLKFACQSDKADSVRWDFGDRTYSQKGEPEKSYDNPGTYYVGVTAFTDSRSQMDGRVLNIMPQGLSIARDLTIHNEDGWGGTAKISLEKPVNRGEFNRFSFFLRHHTEADTDWDMTVKSPVILLKQDQENLIRITPRTLTSDPLFSKRNWEKVTYRYYSLPMEESDRDYQVEIVGDPQTIREAEIEVHLKNKGMYHGDIHAVILHNTPAEKQEHNVGENNYPDIYPFPRLAEDSRTGLFSEDILTENVYMSDATHRWIAQGDEAALTVELGAPREISGVEICFYQSSGSSLNNRDEVPADHVVVHALQKDSWQEIAREPVTGSVCTLDLSPTVCSAVKITAEKKHTSIYRLKIFGSPEAKPVSQEGPVVFHTLKYKVNVERNAPGDKPDDLILQIFKTKDQKPWGEAVFSATVSADTIGEDQVNSLFLENLALEEGIYALSFGQKTLANSRTEGAYYRIPNQKRPDGERQGVLTPEGYKDETGTWGTLWLQLFSEEGAVDLSHYGEATGVRAGFREMIARYQTFTVKRSALRR